MSRLNNGGFTIIETMLFLGITGLLIFGVLAGVGSSINAQRYRDSVVSLQAVLQKQYSEVENVSTTDSGTCNGISNQFRGQSDCVIVGRYISTNNGRELVIKTVSLNKTPTTTAASDDLLALKNDSSVVFSGAEAETYDMEWGTSLRPSSFSVLIIKSPFSGGIRTFVDPGSAIDDIKSLINVNNLKSSSSAKMCIESNGLSGDVPSAVTVAAGASNSSGVEIKGGGISGC
jgi:type II secretory pathway pseudopilin PulG